ncbi:MAG: glycosyltransferase family 39 protein [Pirellulaceae bacterium]|nr:glycosyltransferase family 39 protein [Pirellulaceae bacterium]
MTAAPSARSHWLTADRLLLVGVLLAALAVRGGILCVMRDRLADDPDAYREIAENLLLHGVFGLGKEGEVRPTAYRPPLYPIVLSKFAAAGTKIAPVKVALLHLALGVATVWLTWLTARRLLPDAGPWPAALAALLVACDPILLNQSALVMTETLATSLAILALWQLARFDAHRTWWNAGLAGGAIALAALCRPTFLPWLGLVGMGILLVRGGNVGLQNSSAAGSIWSSLGWRLVNAAALAIVAAGVLSPWVIRNQHVFQQPIVATTHGGYTLFLGNNPQFYKCLASDKSGLPWDAEADAAFQMSILRFHWEETPAVPLAGELTMDSGFKDAARQTMLADPLGCLRASQYRVWQLWSPLPHRLTANESTARMLLRYVTAVWYCGVYLLAAAGIWRLRDKLLQPPWVWGVLLCVTFTAVHTLYWCNLRMRAPLMPWVAIIAAAGITRSAGPRPR